jgi:hypothetical protein
MMAIRFFLNEAVWLYRASWPNIALKRDAPFRGGFEGLLFFWLRWLRQSSVNARPLA